MFSLSPALFCTDFYHFIFYPFVLRKPEHHLFVLLLVAMPLLFGA